MKDYHTSNEVILVRELSKWIILFHSEVAASKGFTIQEFTCLESVHRSGSTTPGDLAKITGLTSGAITNIIDNLESKNFVYRERDKEDRRRVFIKPNKERQQEIEAMFEPMARNFDSLFSEYSKADLQLIMGCISKGVDILKNQTLKFK